jgi:hypothetical protein
MYFWVVELGRIMGYKSGFKLQAIRQSQWRKRGEIGVFHGAFRGRIEGLKYGI